MKNVRLLPVVVFAAAALLIFKGVGLVTNGGYVLTGVTIATSAGSGEGAPIPGIDGEITLPAEPTMADDAPTIEDTTPTLGDEKEAGHGTPTHEPETAPNSDMASAPSASKPECPVDAGPAMPGEEGAASGGHDAAAGEEGEAEAAGIECLDMVDAAPMQMSNAGGFEPLAGPDGTSATEQAVIERLGTRREQLETRQDELEMRAALVDAAEKRLEERAAQVAAMEAQINALVEQKKAMETDQLKSIVAMYETMKPRDAATIFDTLDMEVLVRVARAMSARKMAPIMAAMTPERAQALTIELAEITPEPDVAQASLPTISAGGADELPQIIGQ